MSEKVYIKLSNDHPSGLSHPPIYNPKIARAFGTGFINLHIPSMSAPSPPNCYVHNPKNSTNMSKSIMTIKAPPPWGVAYLWGINLKIGLLAGVVGTTYRQWGGPPCPYPP
ncbi:MAG: hypothetical protein ACYSWZ_00245 [Planctomycetota bacterium]